ncbi:heme-binding protein (plasmid) [Natrinema zhouii]|uniref:GlcG/HbpS family heme-binding protein n=1 Tax=Natrinema zhouii TaxID=1710539 RepID=UPI001CFFC1EA|nr:heme-binding protein [Natrinema zhouii]UHQ98269.1 heme-binding protein [Natrinema zhouii]
MVESISLETAKAVIDACERQANKIENPMVITVTNSEGNLVAQHRMDGAWLASVDISRNKAYTAAALDMPTDKLTEPSQPGNSLYGLQNTNNGRMVIFGGGYPLKANGTVVGAVGVSGGEVEEDMAVAEVGVEAFEDFSS